VRENGPRFLPAPYYSSLKSTFRKGKKLEEGASLFLLADAARPLIPQLTQLPERPVAVAKKKTVCPEMFSPRLRGRVPPFRRIPSAI